MSDENINPPVDQKQCRICLDGSDAEHELGRLIRPCLCKGSISYVHVKCLQTWRNTSASQSAFFACPQCRYQYRFSRTRVVGIATNPVIVGGLSAVVFTILVLLSSFITTYFTSAFEEPTSYYYTSMFYVSPFEVAQDLVRAAFRILKDETGSDEFFSKVSKARGTDSAGPLSPPIPRPSPGVIKGLIRRFVLGLPIVGAGSLVHMLLSFGFLGPVHWLARFRGNRRRDSNTRDIAAVIIIVLLVVGAARALYKVYEWTQSLTKRLLLRAEDAILEVN